MRKFRAVHPLLLAAYPILALLSYNKDKVSIDTAVAPLALSVFIASLIWLLLSLALRDHRKAGLITSLFVMLFYLYGHIYNFVQGLTVGGILLGRHKYLAIACLILFALGTLAVLRTRKSLHAMTSMLTTAAAALVLYSIAEIGVYAVAVRSGHPQAENGPIAKAAPVVSSEGYSPDIYYIILDAYVSSKTLKEEYSYDNGDFTGYLKKKGFYVAENSHSNYPITYLSLASSLNMEYINYLSDKVGEDSTDVRPLDRLIKNNKVVRFLKERGYAYVYFDSEATPTKYNENADENVRVKTLSEYLGGGEFITTLARTTMLSKFDKRLSERREHILYTFSKLGEVRIPGRPNFVFAHIVMPHIPYSFGRNGEPIPDAESAERLNEDSGKLGHVTEASKRRYLNQLIYTNKLTKEAIDRILKSSEKPPVIVVQADHGLWLLGGNKELFGILNAYYLPGDGRKELYDSITPVNTFRIIFNHYLGADFPLLKDESYLARYDRPYKFENVTAELR